MDASLEKLSLEPNQPDKKAKKKAKKKKNQDNPNKKKVPADEPEQSDRAEPLEMDKVIDEQDQGKGRRWRDSYEENEYNIWHAAGDGNIMRAKELVTGGTSVNAQDETGYTPLIAAATWRRYDMLRWLGQQNCDVYLGDSDGDTALHRCDDVKVARMLLHLGGVKLCMQKNKGELTPLERLTADMEELVAVMHQTGTMDVDDLDEIARKHKVCDHLREYLAALISKKDEKTQSE